jgi:hypothetical protein
MNTRTSASVGKAAATLVTEVMPLPFETSNRKDASITKDVNSRDVRLSRDTSRTQAKTQLYRDVKKQQGRLQQHGCLYVWMPQGDANSRKSYEIMKHSFKDNEKGVKLQVL